MIKKLVFVFVLMLILVGLLSGCASEADVASQNVSRSADQFEVTRRIVFYNGITDEYILEIQGLCSLGNYDEPDELSVTCKVSPTEYKKHFLGLSDNVTYFAEQIEASKVDVYHYRVIFRPSVVIPDVDVELP